MLLHRIAVLSLLLWSLCGASVARAAACDIGVVGCCDSVADCDDGNVCNGLETCDVTGTCQAGTPLTCTSPADCQDSPGTCDPTLGCIYATLRDGTACTDDGETCTLDICASGQCTHIPGNAGTECRASAGDCDVAEHCTGSSPACPPDGVAGTDTICRAASGDCDAAEHCDGASKACPADGVQPAETGCTADTNPCTQDICDGAQKICTHPPGNQGAVCRPASGDCDVAETCTGSSATCPGDKLRDAGSVCRAAAGDCDVAETCTGSSKTCPPDKVRDAGSVCRDKAGDCDVAESCDGTSAACPPDAFLPATQECRAANGDCDVAEHCTGTSAACPPDAFQAATVVCRTAKGDCDVAEHCSGTGPTCPADAFAPTTVVCRAAVGACDVAEHCSGNAVTCPPDAIATANSPCTDDGNTCTRDVCDGVTTACTHPAVDDGAPCDDKDACTLNDTCRAGVCRAGTPMTCDDHIDCTRDSCLAGTCVFEADDSRCDTTECSLSTCEPGRPGTDAKGCKRSPVDDGQACTDDGVPCTDDVCRAGTCAHEHVDARCTPADTCGTAICFPGIDTADDAGCVPGKPMPDGGECTEDGDPCTDDACRTGTCAHTNVADRTGCEPVQGVFREVQQLLDDIGVFQTTIAADVTGDPGNGGLALRAALADRLAAIDAALGVVSRTLSGRAPVPDGKGTLAQRRARTAVTTAKQLPARAQGLVSLIQLSRKRHDLGRPLATALLQRARGLLSATKALKRDLRRLQRINQSFAR